MIHHIELELVLIRHGMTQWNAERRYLGHTDLPLLPGAAEQLSQLREPLAGSEGFWHVFCSDLLRCRETLACIAPSLVESAVYDRRLREMNFGDWEGCTYEQLKDNGLYRSWIDDPAAVMPPGGESWEHFAGRVRSFLESLGETAETAFANEQHTFVRPDIQRQVQGQCEPEHPRQDQDQFQRQPQRQLQRALIVTHGGVIRELLAQTLPGFTFRDAVAPQPGALAAIRLRWRDGQWSEACPSP